MVSFQWNPQFTNNILSDAARLDEYKSETHGTGYLRTFFDTIKAGTYSSIERVFVTGVSPVTLDDLVALTAAPKEATLFTPRPEERLAMIPGIGPEKAGSFVRWFQDKDNLEVYQRLRHILTIAATDVAPHGDRCQGLTFVITGDVHHYKNRNQLKAYIESQGGKVTGSVSKSTDYLINNDVASTSGKNQKAHQLGTPIISEDEFIKLFGE